MVFAQTTGMLAILAVCSLCPGVFFIRKLRWSPLEKLCGAIGLSLVIIYLASFGIYVLKLPAWSHWVVSGVCCLLGLLGLRDLFSRFAARSRGSPSCCSGRCCCWVWYATTPEEGGAVTGTSTTTGRASSSTSCPLTP